MSKWYDIYDLAPFTDLQVLLHVSDIDMRTMPSTNFVGGGTAGIRGVHRFDGCSAPDVAVLSLSCDASGRLTLRLQVLGCENQGHFLV